MRGLRQHINSEQDYSLALAWIRTCLIIHSLATQLEHGSGDAEFERWITEGLQDRENMHEDDAEVEGFVWDGNQPATGRETDGQCKRRHIKEALFAARY